VGVASPTGSQVRRLVADVLAGAQGLSESWSAPFVERCPPCRARVWAADAARARTVKLANPLSDEAPLMRISVLSTMVDALVRNVARGSQGRRPLRDRLGRGARR
jgi:phenylalanyl-tRNA synthetase beta chain